MAFKFVYKPKFALNTWYTFVNDHSYTWPVTVLHIAYIHSVLTAFECSCVNRTMNAPIKLLKMLRSVRCVCCGKLSLGEQQQNIIKIKAMRDEWMREATKKNYYEYKVTIWWERFEPTKTQMYHWACIWNINETHCAPFGFSFWFCEEQNDL